MKKMLLLTILAVVLFAFAKIDELPIGADMPKGDVKMKDISGREVSLNDAKKENGLLVMFSCNTCPWVIRNQQRTKEICRYALDNNIGVILVNSNEGQRNNEDAFGEMKKYAEAQAFEWFYTVDKNNVLADAFGATRTPENFLFNRQGKLVYHGAIDDNPGDANNVKRHHLREAVDEMLKGNEVSVKTSRSVGCSIKRI